ncbi:class I SAM-dependent methyltransferase [Pseudoalteromonas prydzensis]|uniref:class I SAM-dependent methyltransferase n=1 Tax=Pseudoalteromonas prydzensis TaxID=182141 RepID=UPI003FD25445
MQHWNSYWSNTKSLNSFAEGEHAQGYVGEIADFWQTTFDSFPASAVILDLATGNGGLAVLAQQFEPDFNISASDAALIDPLTIFSPIDPCFQTLKKIQFYGNMPSENLTFAHDQFDRVISQFGFEYANTAAALSEVNRVLKPDGEFIALIHHQDSFISADCQIGLKVLNSLNQPGGLLAQLQDFGDFCQSIDNKAQLTSIQQIQFKEKNANLLQTVKLQQSKCSSENELDWYNLLVKELLPIIMDWRRTDTVRVENFREKLDAFQMRLQDQFSASWSNFNVENIKTFVGNNWTSLEFDVIELEIGILCWVIKAVK